MLSRYRIIAFLTMTVFLMMALLPVLAEVANPNGLSGNSLTVSITQTNGQIKGCAFARVNKGCTAKVVITIQKNVNQKWISVASANGDREAGVTCASVSGCEYRVYGQLTVYDATGKEVDHIARYSQAHKY